MENCVDRKHYFQLNIEIEKKIEHELKLKNIKNCWI